MNCKKPFHQIIAEKLIEQLKAGTAPWQKPWKPSDSSTLPINPTTGKRYKGINTLRLMSTTHADPRWMTYKQACNINAQVRKGEHGVTVQYWDFNSIPTEPPLDDKGQPIPSRPRVFYATVFNAEQIDDLPPNPRKLQPQTWKAIERAESILNASQAVIHHVPSNRAFYHPSTDTIVLPERSQFEEANGYYATALHELGHWSGHETRLNRELNSSFGSKTYAKEELRAEIASMILGQEIQIGHDPGQHAAYVQSWIKILQDDPHEIIHATADAEKICKYLLAFEQKQTA